MEVIVQDKSIIINKKEKYNIIIVGAGGFGREVYLWTKDSFPKGKYYIKGFLDDDKRALDKFNLDITIIGDIDSYLPNEYEKITKKITKTRGVLDG